MSVLDRFRMDGKVAVITGGGRGIGRATALAFADAGADVVISARSGEQLDDVAAMVADRGRRAVTVAADLDDIENLPPLVEAAVDEFGGLDIVVNNVGGSMPRALMDTSPGFLERSFHFNVTTAFALTKAAVPALLERQGSVVNISSAIGRVASSGFVGYGTAKAAMSQMTRLLAADLAPKIRVNAIAVGSTATSALESVLDDELRQALLAEVPLGRLGEPDDIALCALYLASDAGSWITGKIFEVDGGLK